jgi:hypothetical protein
MPQIPVLTESTRLSPNSPVEIASTRDARMAGEDIQKFGNQVAQAGQIMRVAQNQVEETKAKDEIANEVSKAREEAIKRGKPDGSDYQDIFDQSVNKSVPGILKRLSDPVVIREVETDFGRQKTASTIGLRQAANRAQQENLLRGNEEIIAMREKRAFDKPELAGYDYNDFIEQHVKPLQEKGVLSTESAQKIAEKAKDRIGEAYLDGLISKKKFNEAAGVLGATEQESTLALSADDLGMYGLKSDGSKMLPMINSKTNKELSPEISQLMRGLTPDQREKYVRKLQEGLQKETHVKMRTVSDNVQAAIGYAYEGKGLNKQERAKVQGMVDSIPDQDIRNQFNEQLKAADKIAPLLEVAKNGSQQQLAEQYAKFEKSLGNPTDLAARYSVDSMKSKAMDAIRKVQENAIRDPKTDADGDEGTALLREAAKSGQPEDVQRYIQRNLEMQNFRGIPSHKQRVTSDAEVQNISDKIRASLQLDPMIAAQELEKLDQTYGKHFSKVITEVAQKDKAIPESIILAAQAEDRLSRREILENLRSKPDIEKAFELRSETSKKDLSEKVTTTIDRFSAALGANTRSAEGLSTINRFQEQVSLQAKKNLAMRGMDADDAVQEAYKTVVEKNFDIINTSRSQIIMPKKAAYNAELVERFTEDFEPDPSGNYGMTGVLGISPSKAAIEQAKKEYPNADEKQLVEAYKVSVLSNGKWVTNEDQSGIRLVVDRGNRQELVRRANGTPVEFTFREIGNYTNPREFPGLRK